MRLAEVAARLRLGWQRCAHGPPTSAATAARLAAEYLGIKNIRPSLKMQDSPFTVDNNAGGGFGGLWAVVQQGPGLHLSALD